MPVKEVVKLTGKSESWLRRHECAWCSITALDAIRYGCGSINDEKCNPMDKFKRKVNNET